MPETIQMREGDYGPFQYQIMEFDETTDGLIPVDVSDEMVSITIYRHVQQTNGSFTAELVVYDQSCSILDGEDGWIQYDMATGDMATYGMYTMLFKRSGTSVGKNYPRYDEQWVRVLPLGTPSIEFTP